ncbi:MAG: hypothetical protein JNK78_01580 [Planctomycetes bacterium]|nr:hypothetical protein [Planctomycetota bacterium]
MIGTAVGERVVISALGGLALFGAVAHALLPTDTAVPAFALPVAIAVAGAAAARMHFPPPAAAPAAPRWLPWLVLALLAVLTGAVAYGALATPSRHWDGAAAWDVRASALTAAATLAQPFFADPVVLSPARDYPLLQPLAIAAGNTVLGSGAGRALFPVLFVALVLLVGTTVRRCATPTLAWLAAAAVACTPMLVKPGGGSADSGYGDTFLLVCTTAIAAGFVRRDARFTFVGAVLAVLVKPEGLLHAALATAAAAILGERAAARGAALGLVLAAALWLPLQQRLVGADPAAALPVLGALAGMCGALLAFDTIARRRTWSRRRRVAAGAVLAAFAVVAAFAVLPSTGGTFRAYLGSAERAGQQIDRVPAIVWGFVNYGLLRGDFGLVFWFVALATATAARRRALAASAPLLAFVAGGFTIAGAAFVLSPEADVDHHLKSSLPRLLLHWLGPALLLGCAAFAAISDRPRTDAAAP